MEQPSGRLTPPVDKPIPDNLELSEVYDVRKREVRMGVLCRDAAEFQNALILYGLGSTSKENLPSNPLEAIKLLHDEIMQNDRLYGDPLPKLRQFAEGVVCTIHEENYMRESV